MNKNESNLQEAIEIIENEWGNVHVLNLLKDAQAKQKKWASLINLLANIIIDVAPSQIDNPLRQEPVMDTISSNDLDLANDAIKVVLPYLKQIGKSCPSYGSQNIEVGQCLDYKAFSVKYGCIEDAIFEELHKGWLEMSKIYNQKTGRCQLCQADTLWGDAPHGLYLTGQDCPYYILSLIVEDCKSKNQSSVNVGSARRRNALIEIWEFLNEPPDNKKERQNERQ